METMSVESATIGSAADGTDGLVTGAQTDRQALGLLYERYYERIHRYCLHRLFLREAAEDATSAVFLKVAERIQGFRGRTDAEFRAWLFAIATNEINSCIRTDKRRARLLEAAVAEGRLAAREASDPGGGADWPSVYQAIARLRPRDQSIVTLRFLEGLPMDEIAGVLGRKPATIRSTLSRALSRLRKHFTGTSDPRVGR